MRLVHSISMTLLVSAAATLSACSSDTEEPTGTGGSSGSSTGGTAGSATGGTAGSATGGAAGSATGGSAGSGGSDTGGSGGSAGSETGGGGGSAGSGGSGVQDYPTDSTQAGLEAFLMAESYKTTGMGWRPEAIPAGDSAPHHANRRYFNETIIASKAAGNRPPTMGQHTAGSMSVKELLMDTSVIGKAAMLRTMTGTVYYCVASEDGRCGTGTMANIPYYGTAAGGACACHGSGTNNSHDAIPAP